MKNQTIELPVAELREALPGLGKIIGRKTTLPVLSAVKVARDKSGLITLQGTDLDSTATFTLKDRSEGLLLTIFKFSLAKYQQLVPSSLNLPNF